MKFKDYYIAQEVKDSVEEMGFRRPTDIQFKAITPILNGEDILAVAQTGTGKTAAFAIPVVHKVHEIKRKARRRDGVKCIVMVPTHELAQQITKVFETIAKYTKVKVLGIYGGVDQDPQIAALEKRVDILIATPGRMFDLMSQGYLLVHRVEMLVLDEADHMLDLGFINDIRDLIRRLPKRKQTMFFSATINPKIKKLAYSIIAKNAIRIQISPKNPVARNVEHGVAFVEMDDKRFFLERLFNENEEAKILVFVRTKVRAERVCKAMERVGIEALTIHSGKEQAQRNKVMKQFSTGEVDMLIATDVSARGVDIPNVNIVVNYDLPDKAENYVHRVGRTGRGKAKGQAIAFCSADEKEMLGEIEEFLGKEIEVLEVSKVDYEETRLLVNEKANDWRKLMDAIEEWDNKPKKNKKKKNK